MLDPNRIAAIVTARMTAARPVSVASWRILDDPQANAQWQGSYPLVEFECPEGERMREEYGDPDNNLWNERGALMIHVHVSRARDSMTLARSVMRDVEALFLGKTIDGVVFIRSYPEYVDADGKGVSHGVSRGIAYRAEWRGP